MKPTPKVAMILAAGKGTRMRPLTLTTPKPLLSVGGRPLIVWHIEQLVRAGFQRIVINHSWLGEQLEQAIGYGERWGIEICWSREPELLETGGGIYQALPQLGDAPFLVLNGDIFINLDLTTLALPDGKLAHLVLVPNPSHNPAGDFRLEGGVVYPPWEENFTFAGISLLSPDLFAKQEAGHFPLGPLLREAAEQQQVSGQCYTGYWQDVGTLERLQELEKYLSTLPQRRVTK